MKDGIVDLISDKPSILRILAKSKEEGTAVGINSQSIGTQTFISAVDDIILEDDVIIIVRPFDANGHMLHTNRIRLSEITGVLPFSSVFENPFHKTTQFIQPDSKPTNRLPYQ